MPLICLMPLEYLKVITHVLCPLLGKLFVVYLNDILLFRGCVVGAGIGNWKWNSISKGATRLFPCLVSRKLQQMLQNCSVV